MAHITNTSAEAVPASGSIRRIETDREFKAHVYQQLVELQPYLAPESQVAVVVQQEEGNESNFMLTLVVTLGESKIEVEGTDSDLYGALSIAKRKLFEQLDELFASAIDSRERDAQIYMMLRGGITLH